MEPAHHLTALEASPSHTNSLVAAEKVIQRVKGANAKFRFIYILRDSVQKIESMRKYGIYNKFYTESIKKETPASLPVEAIERAMYSAIVDRFVDAFSAENILLLKTEDLANYPESVMDNICKFLGLNSSFKFSLSQLHNSKNSYRKKTIWHLLRSSEYLKPFKHVFPDFLKNKLRSFLAQPLARNTTVPPLSKAQKRFIFNALRKDLARLETEYGLDVSSWRSGV